MKAMIIRGYGDASAFELAELEPPKPGPDQVLVKVHGSSVNPVMCENSIALFLLQIPQGSFRRPG